jgi:WD40 repeat protein
MSKNIYQVQKLHTLTGHKDSIYALTNTPNPYSFYSGASDGYVVEWELKHLKEDFSSDNQEVTGKVIAKLPNSCYALHYVEQEKCLVIGDIFAIQSVGNILWVAVGSGTVFLVDITQKKIVQQLQYSQQSARCIAKHQFLPIVAVGYSDNAIRIFDASNGNLLHTISAHQNSVFSVAFAPLAENPYLLSGSRDAHLKSWAVSLDYQQQQAIVAHLFTINDIQFSPSGKHFITCSKDKSIKYWDSATLRLLKVIDRGRYAGHGTSINKLLWLDEEIFISCSDDNTIGVWKVSF